MARPQREFDYGDFTRQLAAASFTGWLEDARRVFLAMDERQQRGVVSACNGLANLAGVGVVTAFEVMVATARCRERML